MGAAFKDPAGLFIVRIRSLAFMRFDPFRDFDRLTEQFLGGTRGLRGGQRRIAIQRPGDREAGD